MTEHLSMDSDMVDRAKNGDREAFQLLIQKHRAQAVHWAMMITKDPYLAEDVAQDAILRSFLRLETLEHADRFLPWLRSIVRNKAIDVIRTSGNRRLVLSGDEWDHPSGNSADPEICALRNDWIASISKLMESLTERDRQIFELHFFRQWSPEEIASRFEIRVSNVYNILSRAKVKLQEQRFRYETVRYVQGRTALSKPARTSLRVPGSRCVYSSFGHIVFELLRYTKLNGLTLSEVMGLTGQAFRIQMTPDAGLSSSLVYDWGFVADQAARVFGCRACHIGKPNRIPTPDLLLRALQTIQDTIERGIPALVWNLASCEFGMIYSYDDDNRCFTYRDASHPSLNIPYERLGRSTDKPELFVASFGQPAHWTGVSEREIRLALEIIVTHARGREPAVPGYTSGLASYDVWIEAFRSGQADPIGHAYNVALLTEAREHAVRFLETLSSHAVFRSIPKLGEGMQAAVHDFRSVNDLYHKLYPSFPYGLPGVNMDISARTVDLLQRIKASEEQGIRQLERMLELFSRHPIEKE
ncbi:hypothetical protein QJ48_00890 [Paenibacillus sp. A3]|uniref:RNA polymerase sigma factor n=1 Tax=Paenibacillus sp. A3 TaxID=1337054 RepID=UPI0006D58FCB|nr:sigma-70 family RNA polymerase sigma factor [Paenibacillus sp. A3]KPV61270.1 hypothetical protein QJ48_00890 [Paenibacillus sp. A3]